MQNNQNTGLIEHHSTYSVFKRIFNLLLVIVGLALLINLWLVNTEQARNWHDKQATQLGRSLGQQAAGVMGLSDKPLADMQGQLSLLLADKHVAGVALFDAKGQLLDSQGQQASILNVLSQTDPMPLVFVSEILRDDQIRGYLRLQLDEDQVMHFHNDYQDKLFKQVQILMLISALAAILMTLAFYKLRGYITNRKNTTASVEKADDN